MRALLILLIVVSCAGCSSVERLHDGGLAIDRFNQQAKVELVIVKVKEKVESVPVLKTGISGVPFESSIEMTMIIDTGFAAIRMTIDENGRPSRIAIIRSSRDDFGNLVQSALKEAMFFPAMREGKASSCEVECKVTVTAMAIQ